MTAAADTLAEQRPRVPQRRRRRYGAILLLGPALILSLYALILPMLVFLRYSFFEDYIQ